MELLEVLFPVQHPLRHNNPPPPVYQEITEIRGQTTASTVNGAGSIIQGPLSAVPSTEADTPKQVG